MSDFPGTDDIGLCAEFLFTTLSGDAALTALVADRIYPDFAPVGTAFPCVIYAHQGGDDDQTIGLIRATSDQTFLVKAVCMGGGYAPLKAIVKRIDAMLQGTETPWPMDTPEARLTCRREHSRQYPEFTENVRYNHRGAEYRITVQPLTDD